MTIAVELKGPSDCASRGVAPVVEEFTASEVVTLRELYPICHDLSVRFCAIWNGIESPRPSAEYAHPAPELRGRIVYGKQRR